MKAKTPAKPFVETTERVNRQKALDCAVAGRKTEESAEDVVKNARVYFDFLREVNTD